MAIDEALLQTTRSAILRLYRWRERSVSFGYFGKFSDALEFAGGRAIVRRWTGGGIVPHGDDTTYSLMIGSNEPAYRFSSPELYRRIHETVAAVLLLCGVTTRFAHQSMPSNSAACFANPVTADLLEGERKIAGAAHRKTRHGLLHQGSIQRDDLGEQFRHDLAGCFSHRLTRRQLDPETLQTAEKLAAAKYATETWLRRH
jgi:lipoyl(octanoyl) transferase